MERVSAFVREWIEKPVRVSLLLIGLLIVLLFYTRTINLGYLPAGDRKSILVRIDYNGAFEKEIERTITGPLEKKISGIKGIKEIFSISEQGKSRINITFFPGIDLNRSYLRIREAVDAVYANLPVGVQRPIISKSDLKSRPVFIAAFEKGMELSEKALRRLFENVEGSGEIEIGGGAKEEVQIGFDPEKLAARNLSFSTILKSLRENNLISSFGRETEIPSLLDGRLKSVEEIQQLHITKEVRVMDVASVGLTAADRESIARVNGSEKTIVYVKKAGDANTVRLCRKLRGLVTENLKGEILFDYGNKIEGSLIEILYAILTGIGLVTLFSFLFLRSFSPALLISLNIPFSILFTVTALNIFNYELNILTLSGIAIGIGMVIDSGVVFIEEFLSRPGPIEHTIRKTKAPILFSSATTLAVFFPLLFSKEEMLIQFGGLAVAVTASILSSLIFVFIFLPPFLSALPGPRLNTGKDKSSDYLVKPLRIIYSFISKYRYLFILLMLLLLGLAVLFVPGLRAEPYRRDAGNAVSLTLEFRSGAGLEHVFKTASGLEDYISSLEGVKSIGSKYEKERASFAITLNDKTDREAFIQRLKSKRQGYKDIFFYFPEESKTTASFEVILTGKNNYELRELSEQLAARIRNTIKVENIVFHFKSVLPSKLITVRLEDAGRLGLNPYDVHANLFWALSKPVAAKWNTPEKETDIRLFAEKFYIDNIDSILRLKIKNRQNLPLELQNTAYLSEMRETGRIYHYNRQRSASFSVVTERNSRADALSAVNGMIESFPFPPGCRAEAGLREREEAGIRESALISLCLAVALIFLILIFQFESAKTPLIVLFQIPLSFVFPVLILKIFNLPLSIPVILGFILAAGISVNNCILVFDTVKGGKISALSVYRGLKRKIKAIVIASLTTILGVLPLIFSGRTAGGILAPLSITIATGITGSLFFLLISLPALIPGLILEDSRQQDSRQPLF